MINSATQLLFVLSIINAHPPPPTSHFGFGLHGLFKIGGNVLLSPVSLSLFIPQFLICMQTTFLHHLHGSLVSAFLLIFVPPFLLWELEIKSVCHKISQHVIDVGECTANRVSRSEQFVCGRDGWRNRGARVSVIDCEVPPSEWQWMLGICSNSHTESPTMCQLRFATGNLPSSPYERKW